MRLIHFKKTKGSKSEIAIGDEALSNSAFAVYGQQKEGIFANTTFGWKLPVVDTEGQYVGHRFEVQVDLAGLDKLIAAAQWARAQAAVDTPPAENLTGSEVASE